MSWISPVRKSTWVSRSTADVVPERGAQPVARDEAQLDVAEETTPGPGRRRGRWGSSRRSETITRRPGRSRRAPARSLKTLTEVESATATSSAEAPIKGAMSAGHAARELDPAVRVPAPDEVASPLALDDVAEPLRGPAGQRAERVAVEVDDALGQDELLAQGGEIVCGVERLGVGAGERRDPGHQRDVTAARRCPGERW